MIPLTKLKMVLMAPIPSARESTATEVNPGLFLSILAPYLASCRRSRVIFCLPFPALLALALCLAARHSRTNLRAMSCVTLNAVSIEETNCAWCARTECGVRFREWAFPSTNLDRAQMPYWSTQSGAGVIHSVCRRIASQLDELEPPGMPALPEAGPQRHRRRGHQSSLFLSPTSMSIVPLA